MILNRAQTRKIDTLAMSLYGIPGVVLMENAGRGVADFLLNLNINGQVLICCGKGNNGGDGFVIARHLDNHDISVQIMLFANPNDLSGDAATNYNIALKSKIKIHSIENDFTLFEQYAASATWIIDALFGTGLSGEIKAPYDHIIQIINASSAKKVAVDIPSGLDCDTGQPLGMAVQADYTLTFPTLKKGFSHPDAADYLGQVHVVDIGIPKILKTQDMI